MAGIRWPPEDSDLPQPRAPAVPDLISDDDRSVAADSWSIKSEYGSTLDDEQRQVEAAEVLSSGNFRAASDYSSDKDEPEVNEDEPSMLGLQSYWDASYAEDLANFHEHGHAGEVWFGAEVMDTVVMWTKNSCLNLSHDQIAVVCGDCKSTPEASQPLSKWSVLDIGTGNGLLLQELAKQGFADLTGTDYSEGAIDLAQNLAARNGFSYIKFLVDDLLQTKLDQKFQLVMDKGTLDAIGLHPDGPTKRLVYWDAVAKLVAPCGILVITSCNKTKDELLQEVEIFNERMDSQEQEEQGKGSRGCAFRYLDHIRTYPTIMFGGVEGSRVCTVAFLRK
ncbi:hexaprenyldihydroxybenzoate methyltransferase [Apostasia shenzhenica]|uniref:Protein-lysine N-methyltransferase AXF42_Ash002246 n=1 Tax=Apostasia shenzhenica TaxID=1088818 RepID=A0A2I0AN01_9ASPA|nr:hexaprenyldihydroxybenzoate methyltransferase [Apostasia shenzhenica]